MSVLERCPPCTGVHVTLLNRDINMPIPLTSPHIFDMTQDGRICFKIKTFIFGDHSCYSHNLYLCFWTDTAKRK